jgi:hypothetical protein
MVGYEDVLSTEHEDSLMEPYEGVKKAVELLRNVAFGWSRVAITRDQIEGLIFMKFPKANREHYETRMP